MEVYNIMKAFIDSQTHEDIVIIIIIILKNEHYSKSVQKEQILPTSKIWRVDS